MGYTIKQKMDICLKAEANPRMTQSDLAQWAMHEYGSKKPPSQTTISRILASKNDIIASKEGDFTLIRRRKQSNPLLRKILAEWITQLIWENIPITTPIIQSTANNIWTRLPAGDKSGNGIFNQKWCAHFIKQLNVNVVGTEEDKRRNCGYPLNRVWKLDEKVELKQYLAELIHAGSYTPSDVFVIDEFSLFYSLPLDQIFHVSSIDKGLPQNHQQQASIEDSLTILLGCNIDGSEKLMPLIVGKYDKFDVSSSSVGNLKHVNVQNIPHDQLMNKIAENYNVIYKSNLNKWITSQMFQRYLLTLDHKIHNQTPQRQILVLVDDCSSHRIINVKFEHVKLVYLKNETNHKNPYHTAFGGAKFDYLPMNFGIIEEFKILYRSQQYSAMINLQRTKSSRNAEKLNFMNTRSSPALEVLSEHDYQIPMVQVIEWVTKAWSAITPERIFHSWRRTHLLGLKLNKWAHVPSRGLANRMVQDLEKKLARFDETLSFKQLEELMTGLNVVIPWEIEELIGLVNETGKITLSYASIEEIIGSCLSESREGDDDGELEVDDAEDQINELEVSDQASVTPWQLSEQEIDRASSLLFNKAIVDSSTSDLSFNYQSPAIKHKIPPAEKVPRGKKKKTTVANATAPIFMGFNSPVSMSTTTISYPSPPPPPPPHQQQQQMMMATYSANGAMPASATAADDFDIINGIGKILGYSTSNAINLSQATIDDLTYNLRSIQSRLKQQAQLPNQ